MHCIRGGPLRPSEVDGRQRLPFVDPGPRSIAPWGYCTRSTWRLTLRCVAQTRSSTSSPRQVGEVHSAKEACALNASPFWSTYDLWRPTGHTELEPHPPLTREKEPLDAVVHEDGGRDIRVAGLRLVASLMNTT